MAVDKSELKSFAKRERDRFERSLKDFVEIPTVSADPLRQRDIRRCVDLAVQTIREAGGEPAIIETAGNPIIHGRFDASTGAPTVTVYNHLDVQPASRDSEPWNTDPFTFTKDGDRYLGRGTTDDKGPALSALFGIRAAREAGVPLNIRVLWELEEEIGSPNFEAAMKDNSRQLASDSVIVSDTIWVARNRPACPAGLRGLAGFELTLATGETD